MSMTSLLRDYPVYRRYWLGQAVSQLGDRIHSLALLWIVYKWTGSGLIVGLVMVAASLPGVLAGPFAGQVADRMDRRHLMIAADAVRGIGVSWLAWRASTGALGMTEILLVTVLLSLGAAFFNPAALSAIPGLVPTEKLSAANAMNQLSASASAVVGPLAGTALIALIGVPLAFAANACSYVISALLLLSVTFGPQIKAQGKSFLADMREGWAEARANPLVMRLLLPVVVTNFFFSAVVVLVPILAEKIYQSGSTGMGILMSAYGGGMLLGVLGITTLRRLSQSGSIVIWGLGGIGAGFLLMGSLFFMPLTAGGLLVAGFSLNVVNIALITVYQLAVPDSSRGRVFGLVTALSLSMQPIAYGVMGALSDLLAPRIILLVSGVAIALVALSLRNVQELKDIQT